MNDLLREFLVLGTDAATDVFKSDERIDAELSV